MKITIPFDNIFKYYLDIIGISDDNLPVQVMNNWKSIGLLAAQDKIYGYLISWVLENWREYYDDHMQYMLLHTVFGYKLRNEKVLRHVYHLSSIFNEKNIPVIFLKGAAGLLQNLYPLESRYLADIDIVVKDKNMGKAIHLLEKNGYTPDDSVDVPSYHHHVSIYKNPSFVGEVELHYEPYDYSMLDRQNVHDIWEDAECIHKDGYIIRVPSMTDHAWITMRSHGYSKIRVPLFHEAMELICIRQSGHTINFDVIKDRMNNDMIPGLYDGVLYTMEKYLGFKISEHLYIENIPESWEVWSKYLHKKIFSEKIKVKRAKTRFALMFFINYDPCLNRVKLINKLVKYEFQEDKALYKWGNAFPAFIYAYRYFKDWALLVYEFFIYFFRKSLYGGNK